MKTGGRKRSQKLSGNLTRLAQQLSRLKKHAAKLGVFTDDRELLECPQCALVEDVTCDGLLITFRGQPHHPQDSGLRFEEVDGNRFRCPSCGTCVKAVNL